MNLKIFFRQADIGIGAISVDVDREKVIDFTVPYYEMVGFTFLIRKVKQSTDIWKFINVFIRVWLLFSVDRNTV